MAEENIIQEFRLKNIEEIGNYFIKEIDQNDLVSNKRKEVCTTLSYVGIIVVLVSSVIGCISISVSASLVGTSTGITSSVVRLTIFATTAGIEVYN